MKTPQIPAMPGMTPLGILPSDKPRGPDFRLLNPLHVDQATLAQRKANAPLLAPKPQKPLDIGLFSDEANQLDLIEMLVDPVED